MDDAQLHTVWQQRQMVNSTALLGQPLAVLMKYVLAKKVRQLGKLAEIWDELIPAEIREHTALDGLNRGTLSVIVDSSAHRFQLQTLLMAGLERELKARFIGPLDKIRLMPGQFCSIDIAGQPRYEF
jgi:hypothetical protein